MVRRRHNGPYHDARHKPGTWCDANEFPSSRRKHIYRRPRSRASLRSRRPLHQRSDLLSRLRFHFPVSPQRIVVGRRHRRTTARVLPARRSPSTLSRTPPTNGQRKPRPKLHSLLRTTGIPGTQLRSSHSPINPHLARRLRNRPRLFLPFGLAIAGHCRTLSS